MGLNPVLVLDAGPSDVGGPSIVFSGYYGGEVSGYPDWKVAEIGGIFDGGTSWGGEFQIKTNPGSTDDHTVVLRYSVDHNGVHKFGDGVWTDYLEISGTGDLYFVGTAGLPYGECHQTDAATFNVTMTTINVWVEVDAATTNINATDLNLVTFPDDHYLLLTKAGRYFITYSFTAKVDSVSGGDQHIESGIMINGSIQVDRGLGHEQYSAINKERNLQGHTIIDIPTNGQVSLAIKNTASSGKVLTIDHLNITVGQMGGT